MSGRIVPGTALHPRLFFPGLRHGLCELTSVASLAVAVQHLPSSVVHAVHALPSVVAFVVAVPPSVVAFQDCSVSVPFVLEITGATVVALLLAAFVPPHGLPAFRVPLAPLLAFAVALVEPLLAFAVVAAALLVSVVHPTSKFGFYPCW